MKFRIIILAGILIAAGSLQARELEFRKLSWDEARKAAAREHKLIFVDGFTEWCYWCKVLDKEVFTNTDVIDFMDAHYVCIKLDMERDFGRTMAMKYRVNSYPTQLVFNNAGKLVYTAMGYSPAAAFLEKMSKPVEPSQQIEYRGISEAMDPGFPQFYKAAFDVNGKREFPDSATVLTFLDAQKDLKSEIAWSVMQRFPDKLSPKYADAVFHDGVSLAGLFGKNEVNNVVEQILFARMNNAAAAKDANAFHQVISDAGTYMLADTEWVMPQLKIKYYEKTEDWKTYADETERDFSKYNFSNANAINEASWKLYEKCNDRAILLRAIKWMTNAVDLDPSYAVVDTYAALHYKVGMYADAEKYANQAIETGKKSNTDVKSTEALLEKIKIAKETSRQ